MLMLKIIEGIIINFTLVVAQNKSLCVLHKEKCCKNKMTLIHIIIKSLQ